MDTNNMKSTWPTPAPRVGDPTPPIFHLVALGVGVGVMQILAFLLGVTQILAFLDTNMLVSPTRWWSKPTGGPNANGFVWQWNIGCKHQLEKFLANIGNITVPIQGH